ncbi:hypothetical protein D9M71_771800 [compost metagenome]
MAIQIGVIATIGAGIAQAEAAVAQAQAQVGLEAFHPRSLALHVVGIDAGVIDQYRTQLGFGGVVGDIAAEATIVIFQPDLAVVRHHR